MKPRPLRSSWKSLQVWSGRLIPGDQPVSSLTLLVVTDHTGSYPGDAQRRVEVLPALHPEAPGPGPGQRHRVRAHALGSNRRTTINRVPRRRWREAELWAAVTEENLWKQTEEKKLLRAAAEEPEPAGRAEGTH